MKWWNQFCSVTFSGIPIIYLCQNTKQSDSMALILQNSLTGHKNQTQDYTSTKPEFKWKLALDVPETSNAIHVMVLVSESKGVLKSGCTAKVLPKKCYNFMGRMYPKLTTDIIILYISYPGPGCTLKVPLWIWYNFRLLSCPSNWDNRVIAWATRRACSKIGLKN